MTKSIFITGSSKGLGRALVEHYTGRGYVTYGCSRSETDFSHQNYTHYVCDLGDETAVMKMFAAIAKDGNGLDILVNNAGVSLSRLAMLTDAASAETVMRNNFLATFLASREALKVMVRAGRGRIINLSSISTPLGSVGNSIYSASKAAIENLAHTLAQESGDKDVTVNTIGISFVEGEGMAAKLSPGALAEIQTAMTKPDPISIEEIAHAIDFFASDTARGVTNQIVYFGGLR